MYKNDSFAVIFVYMFCRTICENDYETSRLKLVRTREIVRVSLLIVIVSKIPKRHLTSV